MGDLTANFSRHEFACRCGCGADDIDMRVVEGLQLARDALQSPIYVNSGVRCAAHNRRVGGSRQSRHLRGEAADVRSPAGLKKLLSAVRKVRVFLDGGIGLYPDNGFVHVDVRPGPPGRWSYFDGQYWAIEDGEKRMGG